MSTGYGWEGLRQVCATLLGARHVPERLCGGLVYLGRYNKCSPLPLPFTTHEGRCNVGHGPRPTQNIGWVGHNAFCSTNNWPVCSLILREKVVKLVSPDVRF